MANIIQNQEKLCIDNHSSLGWKATFDVTSDNSNNNLGLITMDMNAGASGALPHFHKVMLEVFNVLDGAVSILVNDRENIVTAGSTVIIPPFTIHGFTPLKDTGAKMQILFSPNIKREDFFLNFYLHSQASAEGQYNFWAQHDQYPPHLLNNAT